MTISLFSLSFFPTATPSCGTPRVKRSPFTTHVLDTARGRPAGQIPVSIAQLSADGQWVELGSG